MSKSKLYRPGLTSAEMHAARMAILRDLARRSSDSQWPATTLDAPELLRVLVVLREATEGR